MSSLRILAEKYNTILENRYIDCNNGEVGNPIKDVMEEMYSKHIPAEPSERIKVDSWVDKDAYFHRIDGPARIFSSDSAWRPGEQDYFIHGWLYTPEQHRKRYEEWKIMYDVIIQANQDASINTHF